MGGIAGADAICQATADGANLGSTWRAWLSAGGSSPSSRFDQSTEPYRLLDGTLVANNWNDLTDNSLAHPISMAEDGTTLTNGEVWTGTFGGGTASSSDCSDWTSASVNSTGRVGALNQSDNDWTNIYTQFCNRSNVRLYCFESTCGIDTCGAQSACVDNACEDSRRMFVTKSFVGADFGGVSGADTICQGLATTNSLGGNWRAWVSDGTGSPETNFAQASVPYRLLDGTLVANDWADLTDGTLSHAINMAEDGTTLTSGEVWTATSSTGNASSVDCSDWTSASVNVTGRVGSLNQTDGDWTNIYSQFCNRTNVRLYCVEQ